VGLPWQLQTFGNGTVQTMRIETLGSAKFLRIRVDR